jgi:hypothetical protein
MVDSESILQRAEEVRTRGYTVLRGHIPFDLVAMIAEAFQPIYEANLETIRTNPNRGPMRHYIDLPFARPFYQSAIHGDPVIVAIVRNLMGEDVELDQYASDTPAKGSVYQEWHSDIKPLFPEEPQLHTPPAVLTANFPFVDVGPENGPFEVADGSHRLPFDEAKKKIESGELEHQPLFMNIGDVLIRDPRCLHRGTPNKTDTPRPVAVYTFERPWSWQISRHHVNKIDRAFYETLSELEKQLFCRIVSP